ncbi:MAG: NAD(P)/FAD-dependent oxidoreductase [Bdellovibrionota bacterium]
MKQSNTIQPPGTADIVILGAGLAGLTLALQIRQSHPDVSIAMLEKNTFPLEEAAHKVGESTVEIGAHYFADVLECRKHLETDELPKLGLRYFFTRDGNAKIDQRLEFGSNRFFPTGSFQIDRGRFENYLAEKCRASGILLLEGARVRDVSVHPGDRLPGDRLPGDRHIVTFTQGSEEQRQIESRWLIDAAGRSSVLKKKLGLEADSNHHTNAVWFRIAEEISLNEWSDDPQFTKENVGEYSRWFSTNHLMGRGYWVWLIPLASGSTSVGIVADPAVHPLSEFNSLDKAMDWLRRNEPQCASHIEPHLGKLQDFLALKHYSHWCKQVFSSERWAVTGDAGLFIDPLYSPGSDFIALSNTFIADLISKDLADDRLDTYAHVYNEVYLGFASNTFSVFENQYPILGNATVMPMKIIWDFATYWGFLAWVFFQKQQCNLLMLSRLRNYLGQVSEMNMFMQHFFREWNKIPQPEIGGRMIDIQRIEFLYAMNERLREPVSETEFEAQLIRNVALLQELKQELLGIASRGAKLPGGLLANLELPDQIAPLPSTALEKINDQSPSVTGAKPLRKRGAVASSEANA